MSKIAIEPHHGTVKVLWNGHVIARSEKALDLIEGGASAVLYVPRADADMAFFERSERTTRCPYKGEANYFTLHDGKNRDENAVWTYEAPIAGVEPIKDHLAFYPNKVTIEG